MFKLNLFILLKVKKSCSSSEYLDKDECKPKRHYLESCFSSSQCEDAQALLCVNATCNCLPSFRYYNIEVRKCTNKKQEFEICSFSNECLNPMSCISKKCQCNTNEYFDEINLNCAKKTLFNNSCETSKTCDEALGLSCQNRRCKCQEAKQFWSINSNKCLDKYQYGKIGCMANDQCTSNLICNLVENNCSCPLKSVPNMCDCERNKDISNYWNGEECVPAGELLSSCKHDYECRDPLFCLGSPFKKCSSNILLKFFTKTNHSFVLFNSGLNQFFFILFFLYFYMN